MNKITYKISPNRNIIVRCPGCKRTYNLNKKYNTYLNFPDNFYSNTNFTFFAVRISTFYLHCTQCHTILNLTLDVLQ